MLKLLLAEKDLLILGSVEGFSHILVGIVISSVLLVRPLGFIIGCAEVFLQELDDI